MAYEQSGGGGELKLRSCGVGRFMSAAFLAFWLCGWAVGEGFVLWILITGAAALVTGRPPEAGREPLQVGPALFMGAFLLAWLALWTVGGIAAIAELLRLLWGEDRIQVASGRLTVTWGRGPFQSQRVFERETIRAVSLTGFREHLILRTERESIELSGLGSQEERREGAAVLRAAIGLSDDPSVSAAIPRGWEEVITSEGERALVADRSTRRAQARAASVVAMLLAALTFVLGRESIGHRELLIPAIICLGFTIGLTALTLWLARGRWEWRVGGGRLTLRKRYGSRVRDVFEARGLMLDISSDSDGDPWYELHALAGEKPESRATLGWRAGAPKNSRTVWRLMNDDARVRNLAAWLARETGLDLEDRTTRQAQEQSLADLRAALEKAGPLGQWAAKVTFGLTKPKKETE